MTPDPFLRNQAVALGGVLVLCGIAGLWGVAAVGVLATAALWVPLRRNYARRRRAWDAPPDLEAVRSRRGLDRLVDRSSAGVLAAGIAGMAAGAALSIDIPTAYGASTAVALLLVAGGIFWSSLIDWFWVLPRVSGLLGHRSCRVTSEEGAPPVSWEEVTRWWLLHRALAALFFSLGVAGILATIGGLIALAANADPVAQAMVGALVLFVTAAIAIYRKHVAAAVPLILHPEILVGVAFDDREEGPCWPVDVAAEGFKVVRLADLERRGREALTGSSPRFNSRKGDTTIPLEDIQKRRRGDAAFSCRDCTGINWYCLQNPDAWDKTMGAARRRAAASAASTSA